MSGPAHTVSKMENHFLVVVAFAILAQGSCARAPQTTAYGHSPRKSAILDQIDADQEAALTSKFAAFNTAFDIIDTYSAELISGLESETDNSLTLITEALLNAKDSIDSSINSILLVTGNDCSAAETARVATKANLDELFSLVPVAIGLAASGNYTSNQVQYEVIGVAARQTLADLVVSVYGAIRTCSNIHDAKVLAALAIHEEGSDLGLRYTVNAVLNAIKRLAYAFSTGTKDLETIISELKDERNRALLGIRTDVENKFSALKALHLINNLKKLGHASDLFIIQYSRTAEFYRYQGAFESIFGMIKYYLTRVTLNLSDAGDDDFSPTDAAVALAAARFKAGLRILVDTVIAIEPEALSLAADTWDFFVTYCDEMPEAYRDMVLSTQIQNVTYTELVAYFELLKTTTFAEGAEEFAKVTFNFLRNDQFISNQIEKQLTTLQKATVTVVNELVTNTVDAIIILAKVSYGVEAASEDQFTAVQLAEDRISSVLKHFTYLTSAARILLL